MHLLGRFLNSPLARHPNLLARKVGTRVGLYREDTPVVPAPPATVRYPQHWEQPLLEWVREIPLNPGPHKFDHVFGHDFDEALLLKLCREGPNRGATGLLADIKLPWEYSRGQPLFTNAALGPGQAEYCGAFLNRWLESNGDTNGLNWTCAMEVAIRAVNWIFADILFRGALSRHVGPEKWAAWLWRHGQVIWRRLEARLVSSNHYLADLLGLFIIASVLPEDRSAERWRQFALSEFPRALLAQTYRDGALNEAALRYHAYVTEMALLFRLAQGSAFPEKAEARLHDMCRIVADFQDCTGDVFSFGDDDSGRVLALDSVSPLGRREILLRLARLIFKRKFEPAECAVYPEAGWCVRTIGDFRLALDFGGVGLCGMGAHAHNDDFSFCLDWRGHPVIVDPGTYLYTGDPEARNRFRSTLAHNTVTADGNEQRPLDSALFQLRGQVRSHPLRAEEDRWTLSRELNVDVVHVREIRSADGAIIIRDSLACRTPRTLEWRFTLHPDVFATKTSKGFALSLPNGSKLNLEADSALEGIELELAAAEYSASYGHRTPTQRCLARTSAKDFEIRWRISASN